jgi:uncharacterized membrane protein
MPYVWVRRFEEAPASSGASSFGAGEGAAELKLWPHQSLSHAGFVWFIGISVALLAVPLVASLGSPVLWVLLAFFALAIGGVWYAIARNRYYRSGQEVLVATRDRVRLTHEKPDGEVLSWEANPYWVRIRLIPEGAKVENYLTLTGAGREVEIGAFLAPEERQALKGELEDLFWRLRRVAPR